MKKKIIGKLPSQNEFNKPSTIMRAGITADIKYTRGKQLVEHEPLKLIPDPNNPRPGEVIDDVWLKQNLLIGTEFSLCKFNPQSNEYEIPELAALDVITTPELEESYNFLRALAFSIRQEGLIEPIEIFLADKENEPDYFANNDLEYGYVILEGHQRRLAAMMAGVATITCIEITDESFLAKLKLQHRKLRRQLSENNLRKGLTVSQNLQIVKALLASEQRITAKELSSIIGLNEMIANTLKRICANPEQFPPVLFSMIDDNKLTFKSLRRLVTKTYSDIENELRMDAIKVPVIKLNKARGRQGGAVKKSAIFKVQDHEEAILLQRLLISKFPELPLQEISCTYQGLELLLKSIKELALLEN